MKKFVAAAVAASMFAGAGVAVAKPVEKVAVRVSTAGVDFNDPASVEKFRTQVQRAINAACNPGDRLGADMAPDFACRKSMAVNANTRIAQLQVKRNAAYATMGE